MPNRKCCIKLISTATTRTGLRPSSPLTIKRHALHDSVCYSVTSAGAAAPCPSVMRATRSLAVLLLRCAVPPRRAHRARSAPSAQHH